MASYFFWGMFTLGMQHKFVASVFSVMDEYVKLISSIFSQNSCDVITSLLRPSDSDIRDNLIYMCVKKAIIYLTITQKLRHFGNYDVK